MMQKVEKVLEVRSNLKTKTLQIVQSQRKKSPEELVDSVNRKYRVVFGQGDLVNLKPNVADLEVEDLMSYLKTGNVS